MEYDRITIKPDGIHELDQCDFVEVEKLANVTVQILQCRTCGRISIGWLRQPNTINLLEDEDEKHIKK